MTNVTSHPTPSPCRAEPWGQNREQSPDSGVLLPFSPDSASELEVKSCELIHFLTVYLRQGFLLLASGNDLRHLVPEMGWGSQPPLSLPSVAGGVSLVHRAFPRQPGQALS